MLRLSDIGEAQASRALYAVCALGVAAGVGLALWRWLFGPTYWYDEAFSLVVAQGLLESPGITMTRLVLPDVHPPLYYFLLSAWVWLFGDGEVAARAPSLLGCLGALGVLWWMGRSMLSRPAMALALLWLSTNWLWVIYAGEARMYGLLMCGGAWISLTFARLWMAGGAPAPGPFRLLCLAGLPIAFLHYSGMVLLGSALLLLLLRHPRRWDLWPPALAAGLLCAGWGFYHQLQSLGAWWIGEFLGGQPLALVLARTMGTLFFPRDIFRPFSLPGTAKGTIWLVLSGVYILAALLWWRQVRAAGGWRHWRAGADAGERHLLRSQLLLFGTFFSVMFAIHLWQPSLIFKALVAVRVPVAICVGCLGALVFSRRHLSLAGISLAFATVSVVAAFVAADGRWGRWFPYDSKGLREIAAREAARTTGAPVFHWRSGNRILPMHGQNLLQVAGILKGLLRMTALRTDLMMVDARHFVPPFYFVRAYRVRGDFFRRAGLQVEYLSDHGPEGPDDPYDYASFLVTEPAP